MGGDVKAPSAGKAPTFLFATMKDAMAGNLDRVQIIKGQGDAKDAAHENVQRQMRRQPPARCKWQIARRRNTVDDKTATYTNIIGAAELVGSFTDPDFDPKLRAFY